MDMNLVVHVTKFYESDSPNNVYFSTLLYLNCDVMNVGIFLVVSNDCYQVDVAKI